MRDYLFITIMAADGKLFQAEKRLASFMREEMDPGVEAYIWDSIDQHILAEVGFVDQHRYSFERTIGPFQEIGMVPDRFADDGHDLWSTGGIHLLDGPLAGQDRLAYVGGSKTLEIPVMDAYPSIWDSTISPEEMPPVPYRTRTLTYNLHDRHGEIFGLIR